MKKNLRKIVSTLLIVGMTVSMVTGCGSKAVQETTAEAGKEIAAAVEADPASISAHIEVGGWPSGDDGFKAAMEGFNAVYPNIEVELVFTDTTSHHQALQTALAAGEGAPDVAMVEGAYIAQYRNSTALTDLNLLGAQDVKNDFGAFKWEQAVSDDGKRLVAIPWDLGPTLYYYRTDVFEEVGLPTDPKEVADLMSTWNGVLQVAEKVSIPGQRWFLPSAAYPYQWMFINRDYYDEKLNLVLEREGDLDCIEACLKIRENGWDMNIDMWSGEAYAAYAAGTCVSVAAGSWFSGFLKTDIDPDGAGHWGATVLPGSMPATNWGGSFLVIPEQSENKEAAWAFVKYMLATSEGQNAMFKAVDYFPAYEPAWSAAPELYTDPDPYFGGQSPNAIAAQIAAEVPAVYNTIMDTTAEGCIYSSFNAGAEAGDTPEQIRERLGNDIEAACAELKQQQIQTLKDAGVWQE
ncbi:MAG: extracellular solute-binding protein [Lachnospiraceae bacterium]|nr:extracellular solute-binding protein [Lachnospiraceae bacterium]